VRLLPCDVHGEPHPDNVLSTTTGLLFIDLETCCRGPVEFDLAAWRWDPGDQLPNGQRAARELLSALREGPPWPALDVVMRRPF
jgi:Ser/Thr protein kinase RdoA (MazF antagonist)